MQGKHNGDAQTVLLSFREAIMAMCRRFFGMVLVAAIAFSGCGPGVQNGNLVPVVGTVTLDGQPLAGASVTFVGAGSTPGLGGVGISDDSGKFEISHFRAGKGLDPGEYKVVVSKLVLSNGQPIPAGTVSVAELSTRDLVPRRYSDFNNATLSVTVTPGGEPVSLDLLSR